MRRQISCIHAEVHRYIAHIDCMISAVLGDRSRFEVVVANKVNECVLDLYRRILVEML